MGFEMSDIQLLKDAAKAAGWLVVGETNKMVCSENDLAKGGLCIRTGEGFDSFWNPLTDDGDALRLAVKLKLDLHHDMNEEPYVSVWIRPETKYFNLEYTDDVFADTRRAIVRASAEIGKTL